MTAIHVITLTLVMALFGARLVSFPFVAIVGAIVERRVAQESQDVVILFAVQVLSALVTFLVGLLFHVPWYGCVIAGFLVGVTSYAVRNPAYDERELDRLEYSSEDY